jgi:hypothetical protein
MIVTTNPLEVPVRTLQAGSERGPQEFVPMYQVVRGFL